MHDRNAQLERDVQRYEERKRIEKDVGNSIHRVVAPC